MGAVVVCGDDVEDGHDVGSLGGSAVERLRLVHSVEVLPTLQGRWKPLGPEHGF